MCANCRMATRWLARFAQRQPEASPASEQMRTERARPDQSRGRVTASRTVQAVSRRRSILDRRPDCRGILHALGRWGARRVGRQSAAVNSAVASHVVQTRGEPLPTTPDRLQAVRDSARSQLAAASILGWEYRPSGSRLWPQRTEQELANHSTSVRCGTSRRRSSGRPASRSPR